MQTRTPPIRGMRGEAGPENLVLDKLLARLIFTSYQGSYEDLLCMHSALALTNRRDILIQRRLKTAQVRYHADAHPPH
jgi:hypothetical protein